jgi:glycosyltransferase involved in cell wall biosynthesis
MRFKSETDLEKENQPIVTVRMPVTNMAWCIKQVLFSLLQRDYPKERIQVVFIDGFSKDQIYENLTEWTGKHVGEYAEITVLRKEGNIPEARNICLQNSNGNYTLFWDGDLHVLHFGFSTIPLIVRKYKTYKSLGQTGWALNRLIDEITLQLAPVNIGWFSEENRPKMEPKPSAMSEEEWKKLAS